MLVPYEVTMGYDKLRLLRYGFATMYVFAVVWYGMVVCEWRVYDGESVTVSYKVVD
jgi:hypothetical protein